MPIANLHLRTRIIFTDASLKAVSDRESALVGKVLDVDRHNARVKPTSACEYHTGVRK